MMQQPGSIIETAVEVVSGVPQTVHKICLKNIPERGFVGVEIPELIEKIIIGPSVYPDQIQEAFISELEAAGVCDARQKIVASQIPLRS
jgi:hypothetical protein